MTPEQRWHNDEMSGRYEVLAHTADTGIVAYGTTLAEVFENAALAMFELMFDLKGADQGSPVRVEVAASTLEDLLVDWLSTLLFEAESRELALCSFEIGHIDEGVLSGSAAGLPADRLELIGPPVKAVTYHDLVVEQTPTGWRAQVIFDV
jgi:SHS2 domain-containing protein